VATPWPQTPIAAVAGGAGALTDARADQRPPLLGTLLSQLAAQSAHEHEWAALVAAVSAGERAALRELYERTHAIVFTLSLRLLKNPANAADVTLESFHDVWREASRYDAARVSVVGWIMNLTRARAMERLRERGRPRPGQ